MKRTRFWITTVLAFASAAIPLVAKTVLDFDPGLDFSKYKTFAFLGVVERLMLAGVSPELIDSRVHGAVSRGLGNKGLKELQPQQNPDLAVRYWTNVSQTVNVATMGNWEPYGPYLDGDWARTYNNVSATSAKEGALVVDLIDTKAKILVWRVYLIRKLSNEEKDWNKVDGEFNDAFAKYPPPEKERETKQKERAEHPGK